ncbi:MAG: hypothetical protein HOF21_12615 [Nitrospina sp.]|nr:hypothetical protein [Nitrospina sp.]
MSTKLFSRIFLTFWVGFLFFPSLVWSNTFHQLLAEKQKLEKQFGVQTLECFPFIKNIGFTEDQIPLIEQCLKGTRTLNEALSDSSNSDYKVVGISNRFLRTAGFHTILIPWSATKDEIAKFLTEGRSHEEQTAFLDKVRALKQEISRKLRIQQFYCSQEISNEDCLKGYENLVLVRLPDTLKTIGWQEIIITPIRTPPDSPGKLVLSFDESPAEMRKHLLKDPFQTWKPRQEMYEKIQEKYSSVFKNKMQLENFVCAVDISMEECEQGAHNLAGASEDTGFRMRHWGQVTINRFNTLIQGDFHAFIRYDLPAEEIQKYFSLKAIKTHVAAKASLATKLEGRTKNNPTQLRVVCDLVDLRSDLCASSFETFIRFVKQNRDYRVQSPWDTLMFVDGTQLNRVNFALNSGSRDTYLYIDANSSDKEFSNYLDQFNRPTN